MTQSRWWTSDTHFFHANVIKYCNRPYDSIEDMHEGLISNWNSVVSPKDRVDVLGDFTFANSANEEENLNIFNRLNGEKHLTRGNHCGKRCLDLPWESIEWYRSEHVEGRRVVMCHFPIEDWHNMKHGTIHLHGHMHGARVSHDGTVLKAIKNRLDVSSDAHNLTPINFNRILEILESDD